MPQLSVELLLINLFNYAGVKNRKESFPLRPSAFPFFFATQFCNIFKKFLYNLFVLKQNFEINLMQANFAFARQHGRPTTKTGVSWKK